MNVVERLKEDAAIIFRAALKAADPYEAVKGELCRDGSQLTVGNRRYDLRKFRNIFVLGAGKGSGRMAQAIEDVLGHRLLSRVTEGLIVVKYGCSAPLKKIKIHEAGHPIPDRQGLIASKKILELLSRTSEEDLVITLISGGGSALLPAPREGIKLRDKQKLTDILLKCGASIREINTVRKHLSMLKGGQLAMRAYPSVMISLILSDIVGDPIDSIASGPTAPDRTTFKDCMEILKRYRIERKTPASILRFLEKGMSGQIEETPEEDDPAFLKTQNLIVGNNLKSARAARQKAKEFGYNALILSTMLEGEAREAARVHASMLKEVLKSGNPVRSPACIISGGETTVTVRGKGLGGRNQEFVLASAIEIDGLKNAVVLSAGTDGTDGPTDAAGAIADGFTVSRACGLKMDPRKYLDSNDSYHFFKELGDLIVTGPTGTNVMDIRIMLIDKED
ncbi:MAG: glycerate kinase [Acidobacteriota bacterium]